MIAFTFVGVFILILLSLILVFGILFILVAFLLKESTFIEVADFFLGAITMEKLYKE